MYEDTHRTHTYSIATGYVHFACHGHFNSADPAASGLQLAGNRYLTVPMIVRDLKLARCRLVTLSACETAMVDVQHLPDEFVGLPAAFHMAGAPGLVATFWSVLDRPTAEMIARFYALHLEGDGMPPAAALRQAVLDLRDAGVAASADAGGAVSTSDRSRQAGIGELSDAEISEHAAQSQNTPPPAALTPEVLRLFALPIVWAAYAHHGV